MYLYIKIALIFNFIFFYLDLYNAAIPTISISNSIPVAQTIVPSTTNAIVSAENNGVIDANYIASIKSIISSLSTQVFYKNPGFTINYNQIGKGCFLNFIFNFNNLTNFNFPKLYKDFSNLINYLNSNANLAGSEIVILNFENALQLFIIQLLSSIISYNLNFGTFNYMQFLANIFSQNNNFNLMNICQVAIANLNNIQALLNGNYVLGVVTTMPVTTVNLNQLLESFNSLLNLYNQIFQSCSTLYNSGITINQQSLNFDISNFNLSNSSTQLLLAINNIISQCPSNNLNNFQNSKNILNILTQKINSHLPNQNAVAQSVVAPVAQVNNQVNINNIATNQSQVVASEANTIAVANTTNIVNSNAAPISQDKLTLSDIQFIKNLIIQNKDLLPSKFNFKFVSTPYYGFKYNPVKLNSYTQQQYNSILAFLKGLVQQLNLSYPVLARCLNLIINRIQLCQLIYASSDYVYLNSSSGIGLTIAQAANGFQINVGNFNNLNASNKSTIMTNLQNFISTIQSFSQNLTSVEIADSYSFQATYLINSLTTILDKIV